MIMIRYCKESHFLNINKIFDSYLLNSLDAYQKIEKLREKMRRDQSFKSFQKELKIYNFLLNLIKTMHNSIKNTCFSFDFIKKT